MNNREVIKSTLDICKRGYYDLDSNRIPLSLTYEEMERAQVYLPEDVKGLIDEVSSRPSAEDSTVFSVRNMGSLEAADMLRSSYPRDKIIVLNFANGTHPGGGVMVGSRAQEEDICRKSTLYISLTSENAKLYFDYNRQLKTLLTSDSLIYSPEVEVFRDKNNELLTEPYLISVVSCAAPVAVPPRSSSARRNTGNCFTGVYVE